MKTGKTLKLAGALAASLAFLAVLAGCGQSSKPSSQKDSTSGTSQSSTHPSSSSPLPSTSTSTPSSSSTSASASNTPSSSTSSSTPAASSSAPSSTTESRPSNEVLYLLAYIKYRGGLEAITPSDLIVDKYMIGTQKGTVLPDVSQSDAPIPNTPTPFQMVIDGKEVKVIGAADNPELCSVKAVYNANSLVSEYYSTPSQQAEVNALLQEGERHNVLDVLAVMHSDLWWTNSMHYQKSQFSMNNNSFGDDRADMSAFALLKGSTVEICVMSSAGANPPMYYQYYYFNAQSLLDKYYFTPAQKAQVNEYISFGTRNGNYYE